jgi:hypothetical protein
LREKIEDIHNSTLDKFRKFVFLIKNTIQNKR